MNKMNILKRFKKLVLPGIVLLVFILLILSVLSYQKFLKQPVKADLNFYAEQAINRCSNSKYPSTCYDREIPKLMAEPIDLSMENAFKVTRLVQSQDKTFVFCHVLGHKLSEKETSKDPSKWKEVVSRCPSGVCSNGCIHGAFQERFRSESLPDDQIEALKPELKTICQARDGWKPSGIEQGSCYHALGHLTMYLTSANPQKSVQICKELAFSEKNTDFTSVCFDGVFMQIFQPLEPEDFALIKNVAPQPDSVGEFCNQFNEKEKASCWTESWPLKIDELKTAPGLVEFCSELKGKFQQRCFSNLFYIMPIQFRFDNEKMLGFCQGMPEALSGECAAQVALRYVQNDYENIDEAIAFCEKAKTFDTGQKCFETLAKQASFNFPKDSKEYQQMCQSLPPEWTSKCK